MKIQATHRGANRPFERDRRLELRGIPAGAAISRATATVTPVSADAEGRFLESIGFVGPDGDWGAAKRTNPTSVEVDFHARRTLASLDGNNLNPGALLVDLGGGFMAVDGNGGLGGTSPFPLVEGVQDLPGLHAAGIRIGDATNPDVSSLRVASPPTNVTLAMEGGPTFWTHVGDLVDSAITPDFAALLQEALSRAPVEHGHHVVGFVVHSDSIARLDVTVDIEYVLAVSATPDGVDQVALPFSFGSTPDAAASALSVAVPAGSVVAAGATSGRVQGSFEASRVVFGPIGQIDVVANAEVSPALSHAQPLEVPKTLVVTSVDILVAAVTASTEIAVDIVGDLDGKPDRTSLLAQVANRSFTRDDAPDSTWINVPLPGEVELASGRRYWVVLHARQGSAAWALAAAPAGDSSVQATANGGLSWRTVGSGSSAAQLRLRHRAASFTMPLEIRLDAGGGEVAVDLQRFGASGRIDFSLDFPELTDGINAALTAGGVHSVPGAEHVENGSFDHWYRLGSEPGPLGSVELPDGVMPRLVAFSPDGGTIILVSGDSDGARLDAVETYCRTPLFSVDLPPGLPTALIVNPAGTKALVATVSTGSFEFLAASALGSALSVVDLTTHRLEGAIPVGSGPIVDFAATPDGSAVYYLVAGDSQSTVARVGWSALTEMAVSGEVLAADFETTVTGSASAVAVAPDGSVYVVTATASNEGRIDGLDAELRRSSPVLPASVSTVSSPRDAGFIASGERLVVLGAADVAIVHPDGRTAGTLALGDEGRRLAVDPAEDAALIVGEASVVRLDVAARRLNPVSAFVNDGLDVAISPPGNRAVVASASAEPAMLRLGQDLPADWELTAGRIAAACFGVPPQPVAVLGTRAGGEVPVVAEAAISQVVPVIGGVPYRFAFAGLTELEGATAEILWRTGDCGAARVDAIAVAAWDGRSPVDNLTHHERQVVSPEGAVAAEVRFHTPEGNLVIDRVTLAGSREVLANASLQPTAGRLPGWDATSPQMSMSPAGQVGVVLTNSSATEAVVSQTFATAGSQLSLDVVARVDTKTEAGAVMAEFYDELGISIGGSIRLPVGPLSFDRASGAGAVPDEAAEARLSIVVPPASSLEVDRLSVRFDEPIPLSVGFVSEAPGDLIVTDVTIGVDTAPPERPPLPAGGLCPSTPPGFLPGEDPTSCHCSACGRREPVRESVAVLTAAGRPGHISMCPNCATPRVIIGGRRAVGSVAVPVREFVVGTTRLPAGAAVRPHLTVDDDLATIDGIASGRVARLRPLGIRSLVDLAAADTATVASIRGISEDMAIRFIGEARRIVRERGRTVLVDVAPNRR